MTAKQTLVLATNFYYEAKGREYFREDVELGRLLRKQFHVWTAHLEDLGNALTEADALLIRNTGPKNSHHEIITELRSRNGLVVSNDLQGMGDILGKQHLLDLFAAGYPVIPSFESLENARDLTGYQEFVLKPKDGCDSNGLKQVSLNDLLKTNVDGFVIQPQVDFQYEVSLGALRLFCFQPVCPHIVLKDIIKGAIVYCAA